MNSNLFKRFSVFRYGKKLESILFPYLCVLCLQPSDNERDLCSFCDQNLPRIVSACKQCGNRLDLIDKNLNLICADCLKNPPAYDLTIPLFEYISPIDHLIQRLKFSKKLIYARVLGELMAQALWNYYQCNPIPECIIPVPLHINRLRERGFNQSVELGRSIAKKLNIPLELFLLKRIRATVPQTSILSEQRKKNVEKAFLKIRDIPYRRVAILDDVVTTGNTVESLSKVLKKSGMSEITIWCCAKVS